MRVFILYPPISRLERYGSELGHAGIAGPAFRRGGLRGGSKLTFGLSS